MTYPRRTRTARGEALDGNGADRPDRNGGPGRGRRLAWRRRRPERHGQHGQHGQHGWRGAAVGVATLAALVGASVAAPAATAATPRADSAVQAAGPMAAGGRLASFDAQMISLVNGARASAGLPAVKEASGLTQLSVWWSTQMVNGATGGQLKHNPNAWTMVTKYGAANRTTWGENVAKFSNGVSAQALFNAYMASPGHKANILGSSYHYIGMGTVSGASATFNTMEFTDKVQGAPAAYQAPKPAAKPAPKPAAKPAPKPAAKPAPKPAAKPAPKPAAKPAPKPAAKPAPKPAAKPAPKPAVQPAAKPAPKPAVQDSHQSVNQAPPRPVTLPGTVSAGFGALPVAGVTFSIRNQACEGETSTATTGQDGSAAISAAPGSYCAVAVSVPDGVLKPDPVPFTVTGGAFVVAVKNLQPVPVLWRLRGSEIMRPV